MAQHLLEMLAYANFLLQNVPCYLPIISKKGGGPLKLDWGG